MLAAARQADGAAEYQRIARVALVVQYSAGHRRHAKLVAVIAYARDNAFGDALRMEHAVGQRSVRQILRAKAQHVEVGDRLPRYAEHIAHHTAHASIGAAERLERRGMVVR